MLACFTDCSEQQPSQQTRDVSTAQTSSPVTTIYESINPSTSNIVYAHLQRPEHNFTMSTVCWRCCANVLELKRWLSWSYFIIHAIWWTFAHVAQRISFYRAMLRRARSCYRKSSVPPSVHLSVCNVQIYFHTGWNTWKLISRPNSLRLKLLAQTDPNIGNLVKREHPQNRVGREHKNLQYLWKVTFTVILVVCRDFPLFCVTAVKISVA